MITTIIIEGKKHKFITQQYEIGTYVADYTEDNNIPDQFGVELKEPDFHKQLREIAEHEEDTIIEDESTPLDKVQKM